MKKYLILLALVSSGVFAAKLPVVASFSILADLTQQVGGERVEVNSLVGANQDAHVFQPSPNDVKRVSQAKLFVVNGLGFEGWMTRLNKSASFKGQLVVASRGIKPLTLRQDNLDTLDPHAWNDPTLAQTYVRNITQALINADPQGKAYYQQRSTSYIKQLAALDAWALKSLAAISISKRKVLTTHDAFAYLGRRYQIQFLAVQGVSTDAEASAKTVAMLIRQVRKEHVKAVFLENMTDSRMLTQLSKEAGVKIQGKLYADALSKPNEPATTFIAMQHYNISALVQAMR